MKLSVFVILLGLSLTATSPVLLNHQWLVASQSQPSPALAPADIDRIVSAFTAKETEFRNALAQYSFKREAVVQTFGAGKQISGEYHRTSQLLLDDTGKRIEK